MDQAIATLKKGAGKSLKAGGMWIYDNEIDTLSEPVTGGELVTVHDFDGYELGRGFINPASKIRIRLLTRKKGAVIDNAFWERRVREAWNYRKQVVDTGCCRLIFGEADWFPGLVVDLFSDILVVESLALGIDRYKSDILALLCRVLAEDGITVRGIYERSEAKVRLQEGMEQTKGFLSEPFNTKVEIRENGVRYLVDVADGQKTGFFLDQKENRKAVARLAAGKSVLDCFTHTGSFALNAAAGGASKVLAVDSSQTAIEQARENAALNGCQDIIRFECEDVFELLPRLEAAGNRYGLVILDPPAFTKSRASVKNAVKGYRQINLRGMKLTEEGGFLATCSCSHFMDPELFSKTLREAAAGAHKRLRQVYFATQCADHPILWAAEESYYLKFYIFQVLSER